MSAGTPRRSPRARPGSPRARLFLALDLPEPARAAIAAWRDRAIEGRPALRPVRAEALHVTLVFLGYHPEKEVDRIAQTALAALAGPPATLTPGELVPVPRRGPRLFALDLADEEGRLEAVQAALAAALADAVGFRPERRAFWPHVTLARVRARLDRRDDWPKPPAEAACAPFEAAEVTLYRSLLHPSGARYEALARGRLR